MFLLDTNVISELLRPVPDPSVDAFARGLPIEEVATTSINEAEIRYGLAKLPTGRRKRDLTARIDKFFEDVLAAYIVPFDSACARAYGDIRGLCETHGHIIENEDIMIAAIARVHAAVLVTRNVKHFAPCGLSLINPWVAPPP